MDKYIIKCRDMSHAYYILWRVHTMTSHWFPRPKIYKSKLTIEFPDLVIVLAVTDKQLIGKHDYMPLKDEMLFKALAEYERRNNNA